MSAHADAQVLMDMALQRGCETELLELMTTAQIPAQRLRKAGQLVETILRNGRTGSTTHLVEHADTDTVLVVADAAHAGCVRATFGDHAPEMRTLANAAVLRGRKIVVDNHAILTALSDVLLAVKR